MRLSPLMGCKAACHESILFPWRDVGLTVAFAGKASSTAASATLPRGNDSRLVDGCSSISSIAAMVCEKKMTRAVQHTP